MIEKAFVLWYTHRMSKQKIMLLGLGMAVAGIFSSVSFVSRIQELFQIYLGRYHQLFQEGKTVYCLYLDTMMFLYVSSILFKNLYYVIGGVLIVSFVEFGRELGLLGSFIALVTEMSFRLMQLAASNPSVTQPFSMAPFLLFIVGVAVPALFIYLLTRRSILESLKAKSLPQPEEAR